MTPAAGGALSAAAEILPLLYILASGYLVHENLLLRLVYREYAGHALYFRVLAFGLLWQYSFAYWKQPPEAGLIVAVVLHFGVAALLNAAFYFRSDWAVGFYRRCFHISEMFFDVHILQAMGSSLNVTVTLDNGKVYIGRVTSVRRQADSKWLTLVPMLSGYRNNRQELHITTKYLDALQVLEILKDRKTRDEENAGQGGAVENGAGQNLSNLSTQDMLITLPVEKVVSLQFFDSDFYAAFNSPDGGGEPE